jgi:hypothetical protein
VREAPGEGAAKRGRAGSGGHQVETATAVAPYKVNARWRWQSFLRGGGWVGWLNRKRRLAWMTPRRFLKHVIRLVCPRAI